MSLLQLILKVDGRVFTHILATVRFKVRNFHIKLKYNLSLSDRPVIRGIYPGGQSSSKTSSVLNTVYERSVPLYLLII